MEHFTNKKTRQHAARLRVRLSIGVVILVGCSAPAVEISPHPSSGGESEQGAVIQVRLPVDVDTETITGRVYVTLGDDPHNRARLKRSLGHQPVAAGRGVQFFGVDVEAQRPGSLVTIDSKTLGYPLARLSDLPAGPCYAQAILNVYTRFERADGHVIWAHEDRWDGQHFGWAPGNHTSEVVPIDFDAEASTTHTLTLDRVLPPIEVPEDTPWVRRVRIQSAMLSEFWGRPVYLGATLLLPRGYDEDRGQRYPGVYLQGHFDLRAPFGFTTDPAPETANAAARRALRGTESAEEFHRAWTTELPRMIAVTFQHPTPYFDDSYAVNSANNGPYQDALIEELIPHLEQQFRLIPESWARVLCGGSTGGYEALALQVHRPKVFGGAWSLYPDSLDFRRLFAIDIYRDENAFETPGYGGLRPERVAVRTREGQPLQTVRQLSQLARVLGSRGRSCDYLEAWEAAFGPVGEDGHPRPLWDKVTGAIDPEVAAHWRDQGYDLGHYLKQHWARIGDDLEGKIHVSVGDMDDYSFNLSVLQLEEVLTSLRDPEYGGEVVYGSPLKIHGWRQFTNAELLSIMAEHMAGNAPKGAHLGWRGTR